MADSLKWVGLVIGGILGTLGRYVLSTSIYRWLGTAFPYGTLVVNLLGALIIGFLATLAEKKFLLTPEFRMFWMIGFLGAFTTFSSLIYESWKLIQDSQFFLAGTNLLGSVILGLMAFWLGSVAASIL